MSSYLTLASLSFWKNQIKRKPHGFIKTAGMNRIGKKAICRRERRRMKRKWISLIVALVIPVGLVGGLSALIAGNSMEVYESFIKPPLSPPGMSSVLQMAMHKPRLGLYFPASIKPMVCLVAPTASAKSPWVISCSARAAFKRKFFATCPLLFILSDIIVDID